MTAEVGGTHPPAKGAREPPEERSSALEGANPPDALILDFGLENCENKLLVLKPLSL